MKTSNKTNRRFLGIIVIMVLCFSVSNLNAQKHYHKGNLSILGKNLLSTIKTDFIRCISEPEINYSVSGREMTQSAILIPTEWNTNESFSQTGGIHKNEMVLEDWMMNNFREISNYGIESEPELGEMNMDSSLKNNETLQEDMQIEDWMLNSSCMNLNVE